MNEGQRSIIIPIRVHAQKTSFMYLRSVVVVRLLRFLFFFRNCGLLPPPFLLYRESAAAGLGGGLILWPPLMWSVCEKLVPGLPFHVLCSRSSCCPCGCSLFLTSITLRCSPVPGIGEHRAFLLGGLCTGALWGFMRGHA